MCIFIIKGTSLYCMGWWLGRWGSNSDQQVAPFVMPFPIIFDTPTLLLTHKNSHQGLSKFGSQIQLRIFETNLSVKNGTLVRVEVNPNDTRFRGSLTIGSYWWLCEKSTLESRCHSRMPKFYSTYIKKSPLLNFKSDKSDHNLTQLQRSGPIPKPLINKQ